MFGEDAASNSSQVVSDDSRIPKIVRSHCNVRLSGETRSSTYERSIVFDDYAADN